MEPSSWTRSRKTTAGAQVKLLRVLESERSPGVGGEKGGEPQTAGSYTATIRCPDGRCGRGRLREDLFYRLGVLRLSLAPARGRRPGDVDFNAHHFVARLSAQEGLPRLPLRTARSSA